MSMTQGPSVITRNKNSGSHCLSFGLITFTPRRSSIDSYDCNYLAERGYTCVVIEDIAIQRSGASTSRSPITEIVGCYRQMPGKRQAPARRQFGQRASRETRNWRYACTKAQREAQFRKVTYRFTEMRLARIRTSRPSDGQITIDGVRAVLVTSV